MRKKDLELEVERLTREIERLKNTSKIPELEERLKNMAIKFWCEKSKNDDYIKIIQSLNKTIEDLKSDNVDLAKQLHDLPNQIVEEIKNITAEIEFRDCRWLGKQAVYDKLDTILKKYGGEND